MWRIAAVVGGGVLYALALPPLDLGVLGWVALVPLLIALRDESPASAFRLGVVAGYVSGWSTQWWLADAVRHYFALPPSLATALLAAGHLVVWGVPVGLFATAVVVVRRVAPPAVRPPLVALAWVATELVRTHVIGQPWALLGYTQHAHLALIQVAALGGVHAVSFMLALAAAIVASAWEHLAAGHPRAAAAVALWAALPGAVWVGGLRVLETTRPPAVTHEVALVQSNVDPARHWTRAYTESQLRAHLRLSDEVAVSSGAELIVWPENAVPAYPQAEPLIAARLSSLARRHGADLLFGAPRSDGERVYNSAWLVPPTRTPWEHYDKRRLVPFAEEPILGHAAAGADASPEAFTPGSGPGVVQAFVPLGVSICHEILHGDLVAASVRRGAALLVNIANDGLLDRGLGSAAEQQVAMAAFRAVETHRWVLRVATTGASVVIDPTGRIVEALPRGQAGTLLAAVGAEHGLTPYARTGDRLPLACVLLGGVCLAAMARGRAVAVARA